MIPAIRPEPRLPAIAPRPEPTPEAELRGMRAMWRSALCLILEDFESDERAREYLRSRDGRMVLEMAGVDGSRLDRLNLKATYLLSKEEQHARGKESAREFAAKCKRNRELEQARLKRERAEAAERKESKLRHTEYIKRVREIDRRVAKQKAAQEAPKPSGQLFMVSPGRPVEELALPVAKPPRHGSLSSQIRAECDRLLAAGREPTHALMIAAFPDANEGTLRAQRTRWAAARRAAGRILPAPARSLALPAPKREPRHLTIDAAPGRFTRAEVDAAARLVLKRANAERAERDAKELEEINRQVAAQLREAAEARAEELAAKREAARLAQRAREAAYRERRRAIKPPKSPGNPGRKKARVYEAADALALQGIEPRTREVAALLPDIKECLIAPYLSGWRKERAEAREAAEREEELAFLRAEVEKGANSIAAE